MAGWLLEKAHPVMNRAAFGVGRAINHALDARMADGPRAHDARLQRHIKP